MYSRSWCRRARSRGYDSIQLSDYHHSPELVLCYGGCMSEHVRTACVPASVPVRSAPSSTEGTDCNTECDNRSALLNCGGAAVTCDAAEQICEDRWHRTRGPA